MTTTQTANASGLLDRLSLGALQPPNRVIVSPLTRCRASEGRVPNALMAEYYRQRASAGLILSEATAVTPMGVGFPNTPGIWSDEQTEGRRLVTEAIGQKSGRAAVIDFISDSRAMIERVSFEVRDILVSDDRAVILGSLASKLRRTRQGVETDFVIVLSVARRYGFSWSPNHFTQAEMIEACSGRFWCE